MKTLKRLSLTFLLTVLLLTSTFTATGAIGALDETPPAPELISALDPESVLPLSMLGMQQNTFLQGPLSRTTVQFSLPLDWQPEAGWMVHLDANVLVSNFLVGQEPRDLTGVNAGKVTVYLNGVEVGAEFLQGGGAHSLDFTVPGAAISPALDTGLHSLSIEWDATVSCDQNVAASLTLSADSYLFVPHQKASALQPNLESYPNPIYLPNNIDPVGVVLVVPDDASQAVLQGAIQVATSLGRISQGELGFVVITASRLSSSNNASPNAFADVHLIFIGVSDRFDVLKSVKVPAAPAPDDGVLYVIPSPLNKMRLALLATGASDAAVLKAASALSSGQVITAYNETTAFVSSLLEPATPAFGRDQSFAALGAGTLDFQDFGTTLADVPFYLPDGSAVGADAYLDLSFTHSQLLDFIRSGILVRINGVTIGSVRLSDVTANVNTARLIIPASTIRSGMNQIEIQVDITPRDTCTDARAGSLFVTILQDSVLHLPLMDNPIINTPVVDLGAFPAPFTRSDLDATTFVLPGDDAVSWISAGNLAFALGAADAGFLFPQVRVTSAGEVFSPESGNYIVLGQPGRAPALTDLSDLWPVPFDVTGQIAAEARDLLPYQIDVTRSAGFLEVSISPVSSTYVLLLVAGNNDQGLGWASQALIDPALRRGMSGDNFAVAQSPSSIKADRIVPIGEVETGGIPGVPGLPESQPDTATTQPDALPKRSDLPWTLPLLFVAVIGVFVLGILEVRSWKKR